MTAASPSAPAAAPTPAPAAVDLFSQALKSLADRSPFEESDSAARPPALPAAAVAFLSRHSAGRRNHRKAQPDKPPPPPPKTIWDRTEDVFRPLTLADVQALAASSLGFGFSLLPFLSVPELGKHADVLNQLDRDVVFEELDKQLERELAEDIEVLEGLEKELAEAEPVVEEIESESSLCWLLGSKFRWLLTSERPNKKRKLLGADAGLDQLLRLPYSDAQVPETLCHYCFLGPTGEDSDPFLQCDSCKVWVHRRCYGVSEVPEGPWTCTWCKVEGRPVEKDSWPCELCTKVGGALKPVGDDVGGDGQVKFAHLFCSMWRPEVYVEDTKLMEPILNVGGVHEMHTKITCALCKVKHGACVRCSYGTCRTPFHPICARESKHQMEIWGKFGCDNIELRAFCSKHSNSRSTNRSKHAGNFKVNVADASSLAKPPPVQSSNKLPKIRLSRGTRDMSRPQAETTSTVKVMRSEDTLEHSPIAFRLSVESEEAKLVKDIDIGVVQSDNCITNSVDLVRFLRKLIDRGRINVDDVALEIGVPSNSLEAALLQGETTSFSPDLKLKLTRWLHDSAHILRSGSAIRPDNGVAKVDGTHAGKVCGPFVPDDAKVADFNASDAAVVKLLPPCRTKSKIRILKDNEASSPAVTSMPRHVNGKSVDECGKIPVDLTEDVNEEIIGDKSSHHNQHSFRDGLELPEKILEVTKPTHSNHSLDLPPGRKGNSMETNCKDLVKAHHQPPSISGSVSSLGSGIAQAGDTASRILECSENHDSVVDVPVSCGQLDLIVGQSCSSNVHPFIRRRLMPPEASALSKPDDRAANSNGDVEKAISSVAIDSLVNTSCDQQSHRSFCTENNPFLDIRKNYQLAKARDMGSLELSPEDEVEGELLYLQSKLLDKAVAINYSCENLIFRVVQRLPQELDMLNQRRWDQIRVTQFLREVQEAKKQGRRERRHREAQAVAAAAAAAAASTRNSSLRKDTKDETVSAHQESPPKVCAASVRDTLPSACISQAVGSSLAALSKVSHDKHSGVFHLPNSSKTNALSCDICGRAETMLNRIFVCSCCKVAVHLDCYRSLENPILSWKCELCEDITPPLGSPSIETVNGTGGSYVDALCVLCGAAAGAFRKSTDGQWVHAFCAEWLLESIYGRGQINPVEGMHTILKDTNLHTCCVCQKNVGLCLKCSYDHCQITFHPTCARNTGLYMNVRVIDGRLQHKAYCEMHSFVQRQDDNRQQGTEELKAIRQIRVGLERTRLLCERIIKREKIKKDLVLCSHEVLASQKDAAAVSLLVRSSMFPPGVSSESATTSINNKSYSGTIQRSDDITVDSTASARQAVRHPLHTNDDRLTDGSSTSQQLYKRKFSDRTQFSGKQLPQRPASVALRNEVEREKWSKEKKHTVKELLMTSDQASMQNQRLPKGFAYVPLGRLAKDKPGSDDLESHEPREPGG